MSKMDRILKYLTLVVLTALITFIVTSSYIYSRVDNGEVADNSQPITPNTNTESQFPLLDSVYNLLSKSFYKDLDKEQLERQAINGLINGLNDPYSYYMDMDQYNSFNIDVMGTYSGVGLHLFYNIEKNKIEVLTPIKNTPAYNSDIKQGDYIIAVNGVQYTGEQLQEATNNIRGEAGKEVILTVERDNKQFDVKIIRAQINIEQLEYKVIEGNIGYIDIATFDSDIYNDFIKAYNDLMGKKVKGIVIDLRDNPGGVLSEVVKITDALVPEGIVISTVDKNDNRTNYKSDSDHIDIPLVVLVNGGSASASEILACSVKDHGVGTIVGTKTYGKGLVQKAFLLTSGDAVKLTVGEYYSPNGIKIDGVGVIPDVEVQPSSDVNEDLQLKKAIEILKK